MTSKIVTALHAWERAGWGGGGGRGAGPSLSLLKNKGKGDIKRGQRSKWGLKKCVTREYVCKTPPGFRAIGVTYILP